MSKIVEQDCAIQKFYIVVDANGYPIAQGSRKLCEEVMAGKHPRPKWARTEKVKDDGTYP